MQESIPIRATLGTNTRSFPPSLDESKDYQQSTPPSFWSQSDPTFGSLLPADPIKRQHLTSVGGGSNRALTEPAVQEMLDQEGISDFLLAPRLHQLGWAELHAVQTYLNHQRNVRDRPRLFAWLATHGFGAQLLQGMERRRRCHVTAAPLPCVIGPRAPLIRRHAPDESCADQHPAPVQASGLTPGVALRPPELWRAVQASLRATCPAAEWTTWLEPTVLLELTNTTVVIGTSNVFARDMVRDHYTSLLEATVQACLGQVRTVEVIIGDS